MVLSMGRTREAAFQKRMEVVNLLNAQTKKWEKQSGWNINGKNIGIRFSQVAEAWFEEILPEIKESTVAKYKNMLYRYILPAWEIEILPLSIRKKFSISVSNCFSPAEGAERDSQRKRLPIFSH